MVSSLCGEKTGRITSYSIHTMDQTDDLNIIDEMEDDVDGGDTDTEDSDDGDNE